MSNLIKISSEGLVSAKELYLGLGLIKKNWARWYPSNIGNNEFFKEGIDWIGVPLKEEGNETIDFAISIEFAKHIAMMARTEKSHEYRNYFIKCEKAVKEQITPKIADNMKVVTLLHEEIGQLISASTEVESRVTKLEEEDFIKPFQKKALIGARTKKVFAITGGKNSQAYKNKSFRSKVYQDIFRNIKNIYNVNEYDAIPKQKFSEALNLINEYQLPLQLKYELEGINNQVRINEEVI
jgi:anti-repressor protein